MFRKTPPSVRPERVEGYRTAAYRKTWETIKYLQNIFPSQDIFLRKIFNPSTRSGRTEKRASRIFSDYFNSLIWLFLTFVASNCSADSVELLIQKGKLALQQKNKTAAIHYLTQALKVEPHNVNALFNLGAVHYYAQEGCQALPLFKSCYGQNSEHAQYIYAYAMTANHIGEFDLARNIIEKHHGAEPQNSEMRTKLLPIYLRNMDWYYASKLCRVNDLWWHNENIRDKTVLLDLSSEWNGRGDVMQIIRYAKHLYQEGAQVTVYVRTELAPLLSLCPYLAHIVPANQPKPSCDKQYNITMDRLTLRMHETLYAPSTDVPYLYADNSLCKQWSAKIKHDQNFKVGFCFQSTKMKDYFSGAILPGPRAMPADQLIPLFSVPGISFYSLQTGEDAQVKQLCTYDNVHAFDHLDAPGAFMDTAALMQQLDLVITVDTSIAHLAGALGVPGWIMLPHAGDFRWFSNRSDSPWYPSIKLFRQIKQGEWHDVVQAVKTELEKFINPR